MVLATAAQLVEALRRTSLVTAARLNEIAENLDDSAPARALADDLERRGWLTPFQADHLLEGRGRELVLGPFILLDRLGKGGMGEVFKARHTRLGRIVALKVIRPENVHFPGIAERFVREARAAASLQHPNVVTIHDVSDMDGTLYIAMELIDGIDLSRLVKRDGPLPVAQACAYARQTALGLQHAYERGLVHRDIKPSNLMVTRVEGTTEPFGLVKILDFGLARVASESGGADTLTPTDQWIGTPDYIAPEQARSSKDVDIRADIYSLGCALYFLLTGRSPFCGGNRVEKLVARLEHEPTPASHYRPQVPAQLDAILARMMARSPQTRFATPLEVERALTPFCRSGAARTDAVESDAPGADSAEERPTVSVAHGSDGRTMGQAEHDVASSPQPSVSPWTPTMLLKPPRQPPQPPRRRPVWFAGLAAAAVLALVIPMCWPPGRDNGDPDNGGANNGGAPDNGARSFVNTIKMKLVAIPPGSFIMGSPLEETERGEDEGPQHRVEIKKGFWIGAYEVTQAEYVEVMGHNPSHFAPQGEGADKLEGIADPGRLPVESITWDDAVEFCSKLSQREQKEGRTYRLPTEAEWEYACRANTTGPFWLGNQLSADQANFDGRRPYNAPPGGARQHTTPAGSFQPNGFGLFDVHGNVWEWCADRYLDYAEKLQPGGPNQPGSERVIRGGAWNFSGAECRSARRVVWDHDRPSPHVGFRVVCEP